ncbi:hypothetical protein GCM10022409_32000 [Hymenobacter glaciei]|uniref:Nitrile hydratase alpha/Thiocyanate hydrolase gamma domain-containing protein n=1 Tax=Hymenobacter glaciei TaxID=877209 RepID=A0ABP7UHV9_9BACT
MITKEQQVRGQKLTSDLVQKAYENTLFKERLISNPAETIEDFTGNKLQKNVNIVVEDQTNSNHIYLNIPAKPKMDELELTDEQLEMIAGGELVVGGVLIGVAVGCAILGAGIWVGTQLD